MILFLVPPNFNRVDKGKTFFNNFQHFIFKEDECLKSEMIILDVSVHVKRIEYLFQPNIFPSEDINIIIYF